MCKELNLKSEECRQFIRGKNNISIVSTVLQGLKPRNENEIIAVSKENLEDNKESDDESLENAAEFLFRNVEADDYDDFFVWSNEADKFE